MQHACCAPLVGMLPLADVSGNIHVPNLGEQQYMFKYLTEHITIKNLHSQVAFIALLKVTTINILYCINTVLSLNLTSSPDVENETNIHPILF